MTFTSMATRCITTLGVLTLGADASAQAVCAIPIETRITDLTGAEVEGPLDVEITFFDGPEESAVAVDCRAFSSVPLRDGWLRLSVDACALPEPGPSGCGVVSVQEILRAGVGEGATVWMGIRIGEDVAEAAPRTRVGAVPYSVWSTAAGRADVADQLEGFDPAEYVELVEIASYATLVDLEDYATLIELASYATLADLEDLPTLDDVAALPTFDDLAEYATLAALEDYATLAALEDYATLTALEAYATLAALEDYATLAALEDYATRAALEDYAALTALEDYATLTALADYARSVDLAAIATTGAFADLSGVPDGLDDGDDDTLGDLPCAPNQVARMNAAGDAWECADEQDLTDILDRLAAIEEELEAEPYGTLTNPGIDCLDILTVEPTSESGVYYVNFGGGIPIVVECYMGDGGADEATFGGGWMRVRTGHAVNGRSLVDGTSIDTFGDTYNEILFRHVSGSATGGPTYPDSFPGSNGIAWLPGFGTWERTDESGGSECTTTFTPVGPGIYLGNDFSVVLPGARTGSFQVGMVEGVANCTTSDNPGDATLDVWIR